MQIKGMREGVLVKLDPGSWDQQRDALMNHLRTKERFYYGGQIALDVGNTAWNASSLGRLIEDLSQHEISLWAMISDSSITRNSANNFGLPVELPGGSVNLVAERLDSTVRGLPASMYVTRLSPGDRIHIRGNATILGDLPAGAEVIVSGSLVVWGNLFGKVHVGCEGERDATVSALNMEFEKLQITSVAAPLPKRRIKQLAVSARLQQDTIIFVPWQKDKREQ